MRLLRILRLCGRCLWLSISSYGVGCPCLVSLTGVVTCLWRLFTSKNSRDIYIYMSHLCYLHLMTCENASVVCDVGSESSVLMDYHSFTSHFE